MNTEIMNIPAMIGQPTQNYIQPVKDAEFIRRFARELLDHAYRYQWHNVDRLTAGVNRRQRLSAWFNDLVDACFSRLDYVRQGFAEKNAFCGKRNRSEDQTAAARYSSFERRKDPMVSRL